MKFSDREYPDYAYEGREDAINILSNHVDELAEAVVEWSKGDGTQSFGIADILGADTMVSEGHRYSGIMVDAETGLAMLLSIPQEHHETDRTQYEERYQNKNRVWLPDLPRSVASMGLTSYVQYVEHMVGSIMTSVQAMAGVYKPLTQKRAVTMVQGVLDKCQADLDGEKD